MSICKQLLVATIGLLVFSASANAQDGPLSGEEKTEVVGDLIEWLDAEYVLPDVADQIIVHLRQQLDEGRYDTLSSASEFASALTQDLRVVNDDLHLRVVPNDDASAGSGGRRILKQASEDDIEPGTMQFVQSNLMEGNVGYVDVKMLRPPDEDFETAMAQVAGAEALIFDLRECPGGMGSSLILVSSYLYDEPFHLTTMYNAGQEPEEVWTSSEVSGTRFSDADVYILISQRTGSACESFSYNLKHHGRATLVGEKSAGAGHRGTYRPVGTKFQAFIPTSRPVHPVTGKGFEGVGVIPNHPTPADQALDVVYRMALQAQIGKADDPAQKSHLEGLLAAQNERPADQPVQMESGQQIPGRTIIQAGGNRRYGIQFHGGLSGDYLSVAGVVEGEIAAMGGLKAGDKIIEMNGAAVSSLSNDERMTHLKGSPLSLIVDRQGTTVEIFLMK